MATLILADGTRFSGQSFGATLPATGEVVFATHMFGHQQLITDPAYRGRIVCFTYPLIGNVGINEADMASDGAQVAGLVIQSLCDLPSNWLCTRTLPDFLADQDTPALHGLDTRALTRHIRAHGVQKGRICPSEPTPADWEALAAYAEADLVAQVTCSAPYNLTGDGPRIAVLDLGVDKPLLEMLTSLGCNTTVYPACTSAKTILADCDGVVLSGGPGDPAAQSGLLNTVGALMQSRPVLGIGLGFQLMVLARGGGLMRLQHGRHGNQPVREVDTGRCQQAAHRCLYAPDAQRLPQGARITHVNLNDGGVAGLDFGDGARGVLFQPEADSDALTKLVHELPRDGIPPPLRRSPSL
ncbi:MAG: carbamoyl phosphate synthase small subunit [Clostridia bacterium]|nr:carbamoyl phosphate synthase small subunit [Clostridia bacterium]